MKTRIAISIILILSFFLLPKYAYGPESGITEHLLYPMSHANIFHLAVNILCLWMIRCPVYILVSLPIAIIASFFPAISLYGDVPTLGFSGVLFAMVGISWGKINGFRNMVAKNKWYLILPFFIPNINACIHVYCLLLGFVYGLHLYNIKICSRR